MFVISSNPDLSGRQQSHSLSSRLDSANARTSEREASATDRLLTQLAKKVPGMKGPEDFAALKADEFTPQKVADRITGFVAQGLNQARRDGKSEQEVEALYNQAVAGIQQGFEEAQEILDNLGMLNDTVTATIDETLDRTLAGLAGIAPGADPVKDPLKATPTSTSMLAAERYQSAETLSLLVKTKDGDSVSIDFSHDQSYQASLGAYSDDEGSALSFAIDRSESSSYRFSVEGDLDEEEIDALQDLIKDVSEIADDFFDGDIQAAFEQASEFEMDRSELASMNLRLTRSESYSAVAAYQQVQDLDNPHHDQGRKLGHMINDLADKVGNPKLDFLASPKEFGKDLLSNLVPQDQRFKEADNEKQALFEQNLRTMRDILDSVADLRQSDDD